MSEVWTLGEVLGLVLADDGPADIATTAQLDIVGTEANFAICLARLGHSVSFLGRVGDDAFGRRAHGVLRAAGVDTAHLRTVTGATGVIVRDRVVDRPIDVSYWRRGSAASTLHPDDLPHDEIHDARVLFVTGITMLLSDGARAAVRHAIRRARSGGALIVVDPNVRLRLADAEQWQDVSRELAADADVVLVGQDDAHVVCAGQDPVDWFTRLGVSRVVVKTGSGGFEVGSEGRTEFRGSRRLAVDPVGAGDAFAAGWTSAWLRDVPVHQRLAEAHAVAACVVAHPGDHSGAPTGRVRDALVSGEGRDVLR